MKWMQWKKAAGLPLPDIPPQDVSHLHVPPPPLSKLPLFPLSYARVQAIVGVGTVLIWYFGVA